MRLLNNKLFVLTLAFTCLMTTTYRLADSYTPQRITINLPDPPKPLADPPQPEPIDFQE
jgi:hypothetical protein